MKLSELCAQLSQYMADYPGQDPEVTVQMDFAIPLHDEFGISRGTVQVDEQRAVSTSKYVTHAGSLIEIWIEV